MLIQYFSQKATGKSTAGILHPNLELCIMMTKKNLLIHTHSSTYIKSNKYYLVSVLIKVLGDAGVL